MSENECKDLDDILLDTVKELSCIVKKRVKQIEKIELEERMKFDETFSDITKKLSQIVKVQEQIKISKFNTCYKYLIVPTLLFVLLVVIFLCCFCQRNLKTESISYTKPSVCSASCSSGTKEE